MSIGKSLDAELDIIRANVDGFDRLSQIRDQNLKRELEELRSRIEVLEDQPPADDDSPGDDDPPPPPPEQGHLMVSRDYVDRLPKVGADYDAVVRAAEVSNERPSITDRSYHNIATLAAALTGQHEVARARLQQAIRAPFSLNDVLSVCRKMGTYCIAADLMGLPSSLEEQFREWLLKVQGTTFRGGGGGGSIADIHDRRPNNWGTHAAASRIAIGRYLGQPAEVERAAVVFRGYLGDRDRYAGFKYGSDLSWQADPERPVGINPKDARIDGHNVDGVLPDDQRRGGEFDWPPERENYVWEGLQGAIVAAELLHQAGFPAWQWQDRAILRAVTWNHDVADYAPRGDDTWQIWLINRHSTRKFPTISPSRHGKNFGFTDWLYQEL